MQKVNVQRVDLEITFDRSEGDFPGSTLAPICAPGLLPMATGLMHTPWRTIHGVRGEERVDCGIMIEVEEMPHSPRSVGHGRPVVQRQPHACVSTVSLRAPRFKHSLWRKYTFVDVCI